MAVPNKTLHLKTQILTCSNFHHRRQPPPFHKAARNSQQKEVRNIVIRLLSVVVSVVVASIKICFVSVIGKYHDLAFTSRHSSVVILKGHLRKSLQDLQELSEQGLEEASEESFYSVSPCFIQKSLRISHCHHIRPKALELRLDQQTRPPTWSPQPPFT